MIQVRKSRAASTDRKPSASPAAPAQIETLAPSIAGWVEATALEQQAGLWAAENVFVTTRGLRVRGGAYKSATVGDPVKTMFSYQGSGVEKLFAATATDVYDISGLDPDNIPTADITGQTSGNYSSTQLGTVADQYMYAVNGADNAQLFDGSAWVEVDGASTPAITGVSTSDFGYVWTHKNRFWFIEKDSNSAWYLPVDSIGGAAGEFSLDGVFQLGGSLAYGATWSNDSGSGMDDRIVFVSDEGEIAVYSGTNPASASEWSLVGVYSMARPLGHDAHVKAGGDILMATEAGIIPLSVAITKDPSALELNTVTANIRHSWRDKARGQSASEPWKMVKWPRENMLLLAMPNSADETFVANINSGAWSKYTGWDVKTVAIFNDVVYFGSGDGFIYQAERGASDNGTAYVAKWAFAPQYLNASGSLKICNALRATFAASGEFNVQISVTTDYQVKFPAAPASVADDLDPVSTWDTGLWDSAVWDSLALNLVAAPIVNTGWVSQGGSGYAITPQFQITCEGENRPVIEFLSADVLYVVGAPVG